MVAIFTGLGAGLARGSASVLGGSGILGNAAQGLGGEGVSVNAATGNLVITKQDEFLVGRGPDAEISRTYNGLGGVPDENGDRWRFSYDRRVFGLTGAENTTGSTIKRLSGDGAEIVYAWDATRSAYVTKDGGGSYDTLVKSGADWIWTDGDARVTERYVANGTTNGTASFRLVSISDTDGNALTLTYAADKLARISTADGGYIEYIWSGNNVTQLTTGYTDLATSTAKTLVRTRYAYDSSNRLTSVTVDLSPENGSIADGKTYVTTYSYDASGRVASIAQSDGSLLTIGYDGAGRVTSLAQSVAAGETRTTSLAYGTDHTLVTGAGGQVTRLEYSGGSLVDGAIWNWIHGGVDREVVTALDGETAVKFTSSPGAEWSGTFNDFTVKAGETVKLAVNMQAVAGHATTQMLGFYGYGTGWGLDVSSARIVSGPGQITQYNGGLWQVTGLSSTQATRIEIFRTFSQSENVGAYIYIDNPGGVRDGQQLIVGGPQVTKVVDNNGARKLLTKIIEQPAVAGGKSNVTEFFYNANGDLIETISGIRNPNLLDLSGWAGEQRGPNLIDLAGWPGSADGLPSGVATVAGWQNHEWTIDEARWASVIGPDGNRGAAIQVGQTDAVANGGGNYTNRFAIDTNKAYEFTTYFQVTELDKHRFYFGFDGTASVVNATDGAVNTNPYFAYPYPDAASGLKAGHWYKIVGYVMPAGSGNEVNSGDLGGIYDVGSGERVGVVQNFRWNDTQPEGATGGIRFFNYYDEAKQGYFTNYYKPEARQINLAGGNATVAGWVNNWFTEEARWAATKGVDGQPSFAIQAGQTHPDQDGGGNHSSTVAIDRNKAYEVSYYFKFSSIDKHYAFFGLNGDLPVENLATGVTDTNPYFYYPIPGEQAGNFVTDRWYKVVGYVLPQGSTAVPADQLGGVFDTTTGSKVTAVYRNFRWAASGGSNTMGLRFFTFYGENNQQYSTYFGKPEIREASRYGVTANGQASYIGEQITAHKTFRYDDSGNLIESRDEFGNVVTRTYGSKNELLTETRIGSDASGAANAHTTRYAYDSENHLRYVVTAEGMVTEYYYDGNGQMYWQVEFPQAAYDVSGLAANASISENALENWRINLDNKYDKIVNRGFDSRGNVIAEVTWNRSASSFGQGDPSEGWGHTYYTYDHAGRLLWRAKFGEIGETFIYDGMGRLVGSTDLAGTTNIVFNDAATTTTVTLANGQATTSTYNKAGELVAVTEASDWSPTGTSSFKYDKNGVLRVATDAMGYNTYYVYDKAGRKTAEVSHNGELVEYRYDAANRVVATIRYRDAPSSGQLAALSNPDNSLTIDNLRTSADGGHWYWNVYDKKGRLVEEITSDGRVTTFSYDQSDRLIATRKYVNVIGTGSYLAAAPTSVVLPTEHAGDAITRYFYDRDGRAIGVLNAEGYLSESVYDKAGQLVEEVGYAQKTNSSYWVGGTFGQLKSSAAPTSSANRRTGHVYDSRGLKRYTVNAQGLATRFDYNIAGKLTQSTSFATAIATADFTYDSVKAAVNAIANATNDRTSTFVYNSQGQVVTSTDASGLTTSFTYDAVGNVIKTVVGSGASARVTRAWYTQKGEVRFSTDAEGFVTEHAYDALGQVTGTIRYDTATNFGDGTSIGTVSATLAADYNAGRYTHVRFGYDAKGQLVDTYDALNTRTNVWYRGNGEYGYVKEAYGTADERIPGYYAYNAAGQAIVKYMAWTEAEQTTTTYYYDGLGNLTSVLDPNGKTTSYTYDKLGRVTSATDAAGGVTSYEYNAFGEAWKVTDARGNATYSWYDQLGRVTHVRDAENYLTQTSYTLFGEVASVTRRFNAISGAASASTPPSVTANASEDAISSFVYDKMGRVTRSTDALGYFETFTYDEFGNRTSVSAKSATGSVVAGATTLYSYDRRGLLLSETLPVATHDVSGTQTSATIVNRFEYDARGNRTKRIEADNLSYKRTTTYIYDKNNRLVETRGDAVNVVADDLVTTSTVTPTETLKYDRRSNVIESIDSAGARSLFYYDDLDRVLVDIRQTAAGVGTYSAYTYDRNGNRLTARVYETAVALATVAGGPAPAAPGGAYRETLFAYDTLNRLSSTTTTAVTVGTYAAGYASANLVTTYHYDANGNVVKTIDPNGNELWSWYDKLGRKTVSRDGEGYLTAWVYDPDGNVTSETRFASRFTGTLSLTAQPSVAAGAADRTTIFTYDRNGNRLSETRLGVEAYSVNTTSGALVAAPTSATISYAYNGLGQVVSKIEASGDVVTYVYDGGGRLVTESRSAIVDFSGASVTPTTSYAYDGLGNLARTVQAGNTTATARTTTYSYGAGGRLASMTDASGFIRHYEYDVMGRVKKERYARTTSTGATVTEAIATRYDSAGRTVYHGVARLDGASFTVVGYTQTQYNGYGDVWKQGQQGLWQVENHYDNAGRLTRTNAGDGVWKLLGYDRAGNQTIAITSSGQDLSGQSFTGALALVGQANVNATYSVYDGRGKVVQSVEEGRQLSASTTQTLTSSRSYNAFGEVTSETNALGATTELVYNTMGRLTRSIGATVSITNEDGSTQWVRPTQDFYYDLSGRLVGTRDANGTYASGGTASAGTIKALGTGNLNSRLLLAGTGYGGSEALVTTEFHPDGGKTVIKYDIHGDARVALDALNRQTSQNYDGMGRVTSVTKPNGLVESYAYDGLGQRTQTWNSHYGTTQAARTDYDALGRVTSTVAAGGDTTTTSYVWNGALTTTGLGAFGGWVETSTHANGKSSIEKSDIYGRVTWKRDLGNHDTTYAYDVAGRQISSAASGLTTTFTYYNSGQLASNVGAFGTASYGYDALGQKISDTLVNGGVTIKNHTLAYDAAGRMTSFVEAGGTTSPAASITYAYDANNNIRRESSSYRTLDANGNASAAITRDYWFRFDAMNRVVVDKGQLTGTAGVVGTTIALGVETAYDAAGQRVSEIRDGQFAAQLQNPNWDGGSNNAQEPEYIEDWYIGKSRTTFVYDGSGQLTTVKLDNTLYYDDFEGNAVATADYGTAVTRATFSYDLLGRQIGQTDYEANGSTVAYSRAATYDAGNRLVSDDSTTRQARSSGGYDSLRSVNTYAYGSGASYALGSVTSITSTNYKNGNNGAAPDTLTTNSYAWYDGAVQASTVHDSDLGSGSNPLWTTTYYLNAYGQLTSAYIGDGKPRSVSYTNDELGQVIRRDETRPYNAPTAQVGSPHEVWYRSGGRTLGQTGNNGGEASDYAGSIAQRQAAAPTAPGTFARGSTYAAPSADFAQSLDSITSFGHGSAGGGYTVRAGDSLSSIALGLWGDANLWYKIAEANGLSAAATLIEGQSLRLPAGINRSSHNASTLQPYDPAEALGDLSPSAPKPPKKNKCAAVGQLFLAVVAVAVSTILLPGSGAVAFEHAVLAAVGGSVASQGVGLATGLQDKFSFKGVALAALTAGVTAGSSGVFDRIQSSVVRAGATAAASSAISQGIGVATGLQNKFSFAGVAAAGVAAGVGSAIGGGGLAPLHGEGARFTAANVASHLGVGAARSLAAAATRSVIEGTSFGDNIIATLPDVLAQTVVDTVAGAVTGGGETSMARLRRRGGVKYADSGAIRTDGGISTAGVRGLLPDMPDGLTTDQQVVWIQARNRLALWINSLRRPGDRPMNEVVAQVRSELASSREENAFLANVRYAQVRRYALGELPARARPTSIDGGTIMVTARRAHEDSGIRAIPLDLAELPPLTVDTSWLGEVSTFASNFGEGLLAGSLSDNDSWAAMGGQFISGVFVIGDIRDTGAAIYHVAQGREGAWVELGAAAVGYVPLAGDAVKTAIRLGTRASRRAAHTADEIVDAVQPPRIGPDVDGAAESGSINLMARGDGFLINAGRRSDIDPAGMLDVVAHGNANMIEIAGRLVDHRTAARIIQGDAQFVGQDIRLLSCSTGACQTGFAQNLSNKLGVTVHAPDELLWAFPNGRMTVGPTPVSNSGQFVTFVPGGR